MTPAPVRHAPTAVPSPGFTPPHSTPSFLTRGLETILLLGTSALLVARLFVPPESALLGDSLPAVLGWFVLWALWGWWRIRSAETPVTFNLRDLAVVLICAGQVLSASLVWFTSGDQRAAINLLWEWLALGAASVILSSLAESPSIRNVLTRAILCGLIVSAGYGIWQHHVWYVSMARQYLPLRQELDRLERVTHPTAETQFSILHTRKQISDLGVNPAWITGPGRSIFENRLLQSREALGRCSLANTFAGLLLMAWVPLVGLVLQSVTAGKARTYGPLLGTLLLLALVSYALLLTKSRTAYLAALFSGAVVLLAVIRQVVPSAKAMLFWLVNGVGLAGFLLALAWMSGGIDAEVLLEAPKSLAYRAEYWWGSWQVVQDHFLLGVGPGNFRPYYLRYKLPRSSEEIADPHNMILDLWTSGGLIAVLGLLCLAILLIRVLIPLFVQRSAAVASSNSDESTSTSAPFTWSFEESVVLVGGMLGLGILFLSSGGFDLELGALGLGWLLLMILPWPVPRLLDLHLAVPCLLLAVGIHLLGAGGAGMPGFLQPVLWFLILLELKPRHSSLTPRLAGLVAILLAATSFIGCLLTAFIPVAMVKLNLEQADVARNADQKLGFFEAACAADPWGSASWDRLGGYYFERWSVSRSEQDFDQLAAALKEVLRRNPHQPGNFRQLGEIYARKAELSEAQPAVAQAAAREAASYFSQAVDRYPYRADLLADWASAAASGGDAATAQTAARRSLAQEELNHKWGHTDKYLTPKELEAMTRLAGDSGTSSKTP